MSNNGVQIFEKTTKLVDITIDSDDPIVVHQGGTSSSKTYSILQAFFIIAQHKPNSLFTVVGQDIPNLKKGAYRDAQNILFNNKHLKAELKTHNKSNREFEFSNGSIIEFNSYDDEQDARSGKRDYLFINEANGVPFGIYEQLQMRTTTKTVIDFNPSARFWAHDNLYGQDNVTWVKSNYENNAFIPKQILEKILSYEPTPENIERGTANEYRWKVYGLGEVGRLEGLVFPDFEVVSEWPDEYKWKVFGMDFGFTNDPTTLIQVRYAHGNLYWREHIYETGLTNPDISDKLKFLDFPKDQLITADSAEPKSITELKRRGWHVTGAPKGKDSVNQGIDAIKRYPIKIYHESKHLIEEFNSYIWETDKDGKTTNKPIDDWNHGIDAGRYGLAHKILKERKPLSATMANF